MRQRARRAARATARGDARPRRRAREPRRRAPFVSFNFPREKKHAHCRVERVSGMRERERAPLPRERVRLSCFKSASRTREASLEDAVSRGERSEARRSARTLVDCEPRRRAAEEPRATPRQPESTRARETLFKRPKTYSLSHTTTSDFRTRGFSPFFSVCLGGF